MKCPLLSDFIIMRARNRAGLCHSLLNDPVMMPKHILAPHCCSFATAEGQRSDLSRLSTGERLTGRHPLAAGQLPDGGGGVGGVRRVRPGAAEHQTLPLVPHSVHHARHSGLQRARECVLHGAAEW